MRLWKRVEMAKHSPFDKRNSKGFSTWRGFNLGDVADVTWQGEAEHSQRAMKDVNISNWKRSEEALQDEVL